MSLCATDMKRPQGANCNQVDTEPFSTADVASSKMNNAPKQPRVIPVQHEQAPTNQQHWQGHNPYHMPQPQQPSHMRMPQPQQQQQYGNFQPQHPSGQHQGNRAYSPHQSRVFNSQPAERVVPIQVVHEAPEGNSKFPTKVPHNSEVPPRNVPIVRSPPPQNATISKQPQPSRGVEKQTVAGSKPDENRNVPTTAPTETAAATSSASDDDHRMVEARKRISAILNDIEIKEQEVDTFAGSRTDKDYVRLEHELTNKLLRLDEVSAAGAPGENDVRAERKAAIKRVQQTLDILELKVSD